MRRTPLPTRLLDPAEFFSDHWIHQQVEMLKLAFADRLAYTQDPWPGASPVEKLLSTEWAAKRAAEVCDKASTTVPAGRFNDGDTTWP